jgi:hypothetical protein
MGGSPCPRHTFPSRSAVEGHGTAEGPLHHVTRGPPPLRKQGRIKSLSTTSFGSAMIATIMTEGIEGIADAVTGGVVARQFEPGAGEVHENGHGAACLNCGTALTGAYCHRCGQPAHIHRSLSAFWHDLAHGVLHLEGKISRTLPLLAWQPGALTRRYIDGERARFVSPMALFLFSIFLMYAVFNTVGGPVSYSPEASAEQSRQAAVRAQGDIVTLERRRVVAGAQHRPTAAFDRAIADRRQKLAAISGLFRDEPGGGGLAAALRRAARNPSLMIYKTEANAYKFSWVIIPISVPFVWLLFLHRRRYRDYKAYDHVVFVTYSLSFVTLLLVALAFLHSAGVASSLIKLAVVSIVPLHFYRQLRGTYGLGRISALWRSVALVVSTQIALLLFFVLVMVFGVIH